MMQFIRLSGVRSEITSAFDFIYFFNLWLEQDVAKFSLNNAHAEIFGGILITPYCSSFVEGFC